jgi:plasmid stability protein
VAQVLIRNLDDAVVEAIRRRAALRGHSLEQELREIVSAAATPSRAEALEMVDRIRALTPNVKQTDSTELIREDRDAG